MFEGLIGGQWSTEAVPVEQPLIGHREHRVQDADGLGALQYQCHLALAFDHLAGLLGQATTAAASTWTPSKEIRA